MGRVATGVSQRSKLKALLFNIDLCYSFFTLNIFGIFRCEDNATPEITTEILESVVATLEKVPNSIFKCFDGNQLQETENKCNLITKCM